MDSMIEEFELPGIAIDNNCAVEFVDGTYRVISTSSEANAYKVFKNGDGVVSQVIKKNVDFRPIQELLMSI